MQNSIISLFVWLFSFWYTFKNDSADLDFECIEFERLLWEDESEEEEYCTFPQVVDIFCLNARAAAIERIYNNL